MRVTVCDSAEAIRRIEPLWRRLYATPDHTRFQSFEWNLIAVHGFADREVPYVVVIESAEGAAIVPAAVRLATHEIVLLGEELFDYRNVLFDNEAALDAAWGELAKLKLPFRLTAFRGEPPLIWDRFERSYFSAALYGLAGQTLPNPTFEQNWRRLMRLGFKLRRSDGGDQQTIREFYERKAAQGEDCLFRDERRIAMVCAMVASEPSQAEVFSLWKADRMVSACLTFRDGAWRRVYGTYYDHEFGSYSPGVTLMYHAIQDALRQGLNVDFMTGEQSYKERILRKRVPLYTLTASAEQLAEFAHPRAALPQTPLQGFQVGESAA